MINDYWLEYSDVMDIDEEAHEVNSEILPPVITVTEIAPSQLPPPLPLSHEQLLSAHKEVHVSNSNNNLLETSVVFGTNWYSSGRRETSSNSGKAN